MVEVIFYEGRDVVAKGLDKSSLPNEDAIKKYVFAEDYHKLRLLNELGQINLETDKPVLFYPACGVDILLPLLYFERLFPNVKQCHFVFNDIDSSMTIIKTILDDIGISFDEKGKEIQFYWKDVLVSLEFIAGNVFEIINHLPNFDVYFERAFRIMKDEVVEYEKNVFNKLRTNGVLISDSGFQDVNLERMDVSHELSVYKEMVLGIKK